MVLRVVLPFAGLLTVTFMLYTLSTPDDLKSAAIVGRPGVWGAPAGDFDWCEANHLHSEHVAEPFNVVTSAFYPLMCAVHYYRVRSDPSERPPSFWVLVLLGLTSLMGIGSMAFHSTLQYDTQLFDELPLYGMAVLAAAVFRRRGWRGSHALQSFAAVWIALLSCAILCTPRDSATHQAMRTFMTASYAPPPAPIAPHAPRHRPAAALTQLQCRLPVHLRRRVPRRARARRRAAGQPRSAPLRMGAIALPHRHTLLGRRHPRMPKAMVAAARPDRLHA